MDRYCKITDDLIRSEVNEELMLNVLAHLIIQTLRGANFIFNYLREALPGQNDSLQSAKDAFYKVALESVIKSEVESAGEVLTK